VAKAHVALKKEHGQAVLDQSNLKKQCETAHEGARLHATRAEKLEGSLKERDQSLQEKTAKVALLEEASKRLAAEVDQLKKSHGESQGNNVILAQRLQVVGEQAEKFRMLEHQRDAEISQVQRVIAEKEALAKKWEQQAAVEAQRCASLEAALRSRDMQLDALKAEKNAELNHMASVATDRDRELRQLQMALQSQETDQDSVAKLQVEKSQLQALLDKAQVQVNESMDREVVLIQQNRDLKEKVQGIENASPSRPPRPSLPTVTRFVQSQSLAAQPGNPGGATISQPVSAMPYKPAAFALPAFTWSAQCPPGPAPTVLQAPAPTAGIISEQRTVVTPTPSTASLPQTVLSVPYPGAPSSSVVANPPMRDGRTSITPSIPPTWPTRGHLI